MTRFRDTRVTAAFYGALLSSDEAPGIYEERKCKFISGTVERRRVLKLTSADQWTMVLDDRLCLDQNTNHFYHEKHVHLPLDHDMGKVSYPL